jgi:hypothetical protein
MTNSSKTPPLSQLRFSSILLLWTPLALAGPTASWQPSQLAVSSASTDPTRSFAILFTPRAASEEPRAIDLAIVVDLSSHQSGPSFQSVLDHTNKLIDHLPGGSRVQLFIANESSRAIPPQPAAVGSTDLHDAIAKTLRSSSPRGLVDIRPLVDSLEAWQANRSGSLVKRIVATSDLSQAIGWTDAPTTTRFGQLLMSPNSSASTSLFMFATNSRTPSPLVRLVYRSQGQILQANTQPSTWVQHLSQPTYHEIEIQLKNQTLLTLPHAPASSRKIWILGQTPNDSLDLTVTGQQDGQAFKQEISVPLKEASVRKDLFDDLSRSDSLTVLSQGNLPTSLDDLQQSLRQIAWQQTLSSQRAQDSTQPDEIKNAAPPSSEALTSSPIEAAKEKESILKQQWVAEINRTSDQAKKLLKRDPAAAVDLLKRTLQQLSIQPLDESTRSKLRARMETLLRSASAQRSQYAIQQRERDRLLAASDARRQNAERQQADDLRRKAILDRYRVLLADGDTPQASALASDAVQNDSSNLAVSAADLQGTFSDRFTKVEKIEWAKQKGFWDSLNAVELSSAPVPDNREIVFPNPAEWEALTARREKYKQPDATEPSPSELRIRKSLNKPITIDFKETPLRQAIDLMKEFSAINLVIDLPGLDEAGVDLDEPVTLALSDIPLKSALNLLLDPMELSYVVRNDVLMITSKLSAASQLETRVYPVADLVVPIANFNGGGVGLGGQLNNGQGQPTNPAGNQGAGNGLQNFQAPGGNGGGALRRDISDELKKIIQSVIDRHADASSASRWEDHFAHIQESDRAIRSAVTQLVSANLHGEVIDMLAAARRHQRVASWSNEAELLSRAVIHRQDVPLEQIALSMIADEPDRPSSWRRAARTLSLIGQPGKAASLLRQQQETNRPSPLVLLESLHGAVESRNVEQVIWSAQRLFARPWATGDLDASELARDQLLAFESSLRDEGHADDADRIRSLIDATHPCDLKVTLQWEGDADLDLSVIEPTGFYCHPLVPETVGGGVLQADRPTRSETYTASQGWTGQYEIRVERIWGNPTAGIANLDIVWHQGTPKERRERRTLTIDSASINTDSIQLDDGSRKELSLPAEPEWLTLDSSDSRPKTELRRLLQAGPTNTSTNNGGLVPFALAQGAVAGGRAVAFDPVITAIPDGVNLQAQAVVSADRRFVRMTLVPIVQSIQSINDVRVFQAVGPAPSN